MKVVVITGSRHLFPKEQLAEIFRNGVQLVITGDAKGVDHTAYKLAKEMGLTSISLKAWWDDYGKSAGHTRNSDMVALAVTFRALGCEVRGHAFPAEDSIGTYNCITQLAAAGIEGTMYDVPVHIHSYATAQITGIKE